MVFVNFRYPPLVIQAHIDTFTIDENPYEKRIVENITYLMSPIRQALENQPIVQKTPKSWRHYCGAAPRYVSIYAYYVHSEVAGVKAGICVEGGRVWKVCAYRTPWIVKVYSDGCWDFSTILNLLSKGILP